MGKDYSSILDINRLVYKYDGLISELKVAKNRCTVDSKVLGEVTRKVYSIYEETLSYIDLFFNKPRLLKDLPTELSSSVRTLFNYLIYIDLPYVKMLLEEIRNIIVKRDSVEELEELNEIVVKLDELIKMCQSRSPSASP